MLQFVPFQILTLVDEPPAAAGWIHEIKHGGHRSQLIIDGDDVRAFTRNGHDWTAKYQPVTSCGTPLSGS